MHDCAIWRLPVYKNTMYLWFSHTKHKKLRHQQKSSEKEQIKSESFEKKLNILTIAELCQGF